VSTWERYQCNAANRHERFEKYANRGTEADCWRWTGRKNVQGYGILAVSGHSRLAHRISYALHVGPIARGVVICHRCDVPDCVNPAHLFAATQRDNVADMDAKGRRANGDSLKHARLTSESVRSARERVAAGESVRAVARDLGVDHSTLWFAVTGKAWRHAGGPIKSPDRARKEKAVIAAALAWRDAAEDGPDHAIGDASAELVAAIDALRARERT
jgi:hypothetical protein